MTEDALKIDSTDQYVLNERAARADRLVEKWSRVPEIGSGLKNMTEKRAQTLAILLENQVKHLSKLSETQYSNAFATTPENMIRLVRLAYPNSIRDKLFTEFAMETAKDSIKYIKPVYTAKGSAISRYMGDSTPFDTSHVTYEDSEDLFPTEMARATMGGADPITASFTANEFATGAYIPGYAQFFAADGTCIAIENRSGTFTVGSAYTVTIIYAGNGVYTIEGADRALVTKAIGRYNSEVDLLGTHLGEVELVMTDYQFKIRPTTLGVSWTTLSELLLDSTVGVSTEDTLMDAAGQEIKKALDFRAVKIAYSAAQTNGYAKLEFDAEAGAGTDDSYIATAQTITQIIERIGDVQYNDIKRGGVSRIVGGPGAVTYLRLVNGFTTKGAQPRIGGYQVGELLGVPVFKVPSDVIPDNELLCVWKNENNEADVSIAFGTLVPFFSTGSLQRKNFYKEAGLASFGDWQILNNKYFGIIKINNIRGVVV
jgi:hypothetical protein